MKIAIRTACSAALTVAAFVSLAPLAQAQDDAFAACVQELAQRDLADRTTFQERLRDLVAAGTSEFEELADLNMRLQIALARARAGQVGFLAARATAARHDEPDQVPKFRLVGRG